MFVDGHFDGLHLGQHLHAALRLARLRRLGFEAVDKGLHMLARRFLLLGEGGIERAFGGARGDEGVVAAGVERELAVFEMQDEFGRGVQKIAVMADDQHRAAITAQEILQPQHAFEIEIVGGFVQQQQVGAGEQDRGERHAHAPAAGKFRTGPQLFLGGKSQTGQNGGGARRRRIGVDVVKPRVDIAQRMRFGFGLRGKQQRWRSPSAASTVSSRLSAPPGASCATAPIFQSRGQETSPPSGASSPRITFSSVDLPAPLRPTRPMRRPAGRLAVAPPMISRPAMRMVTLSKLNMMALVQKKCVIAVGRSRCRRCRCRKKVGDEDSHLAAFHYQSHPFAQLAGGAPPTRVK